MAEIEITNIIDKLMRGGTLSDSDSVTYCDEAIDPIQREKNKVPEEYNRMRSIGMRSTYNDTSESIFIKQAKLMENFTDDYEGEAEYIPGLIKYSALRLNSLRAYFTWRTKLREGKIVKPIAMFMRLYACEIINQIGVKTPEEGFTILLKLLTMAKQDDFQEYVTVISQLTQWSFDYMIYYNLDRGCVDDICRLSDRIKAGIEDDKAILCLKNYTEHSSEEVYDALVRVTGYSLKNSSKLCTLYMDDFKTVVKNSYAAIDKFLQDKKKYTVFYVLFGDPIYYTYDIFNYATFNGKLQKSYAYTVNENRKYSYKGKNWYIEKLFINKKRTADMKEVLKNIENLMKARLKCDKPLNNFRSNKVIGDILEKEADKYIEEKKEASRPHIDIDIEALQNIRAAAMETQSKLIIDETEYEEETEEKSKESAEESLLTENEKRFLECLIEGGDYDALARSMGMMSSVLTDSINEKLFDTFGDTVIAFDDDVPSPVSDYVDELKGIVS